MRPTTVLVNPAEGSKPGNEIDVLETSEKWSDYRLEDGTVLRLKPILYRIVRVDGEYDSANNPLYVVTSAQVMNVHAPEHLCKPAEPGTPPSGSPAAAG